MPYLVGMEDLRSGYYGGDRFPMATFGPKAPRKTILWFEGLRMNNEPLMGVHTLGIRDWFKPITKENLLVILSRPANPPEGGGLETWVPLYQELIQEYSHSPLWLAGMGSGANLALALAQANPRSFERIILIGGGAQLSPEGKELYKSVSEACLEHNYKKAHGLLARAMTGSMKGPLAWLADLVARSFAGDFGIPESPLPFVRALYAEEAWSPQLALESIETPIHHFVGDQETVYRSNNPQNPQYHSLVIRGAGYGIAKSHGEEIRAWILRKLRE
jgi:pimeloyl-ACP methyl ester carboxylesterase